MTIASEIWRDVEDWAGLYQVSNLGRVRSLDGFQYHEEGGFAKKRGQIISPNKHKKNRIFILYL